MGFFQVLRSSVYDPAFYTGMQGRTWTEAAKYYAVLAFVIVFALLAPVWVFLLEVKPELIDKMVAVYPDELEVTLVNGEMSINQGEPYAIKNTFAKTLPANLVVFDTQNDDYTPTALTDAETIVLFKNTFAVTMGSESPLRGGDEQRVFSYGTSSATSTFTKADITDVTEKIKPNIRAWAIFGGAFLFVLGVLLGGVGMLVFHLIYTLFPALLVFVYFKMRKRNDSFHTAYTTALFASIPVTILFAIAGLFAALPTFSYTLVVLILVLLNDSRKI